MHLYRLIFWVALTAHLAVASLAIVRAFHP